MQAAQPRGGGGGWGGHNSSLDAPEQGHAASDYQGQLRETRAERGKTSQKPGREKGFRRRKTQALNLF